MHVNVKFVNSLTTTHHTTLTFLIVAHFTEPTDNVGDEEGAPAEEEDSHDDPDSDGGFVFLHQAVAHVMPGRSDFHHLRGPPLHLCLDEAGLGGVLLALQGAHPGQQLAPAQAQLDILSQLVGGLQILRFQ